MRTEVGELGGKMLCQGMVKTYIGAVGMEERNWVGEVIGKLAM